MPFARFSVAVVMDGAQDLNAPVGQDWLTAVLSIARHYRIAVSPEQMKLDLSWSGQKNQIQRLARSAGLLVQEVPFARFSAMRLPALFELDDRSVGVIKSATKDGYTLVFANDNGLSTSVSHTDLERRLKRCFVLRPAAEIADKRIDEYIKPHRSDWLRQIVLADLSPYRAVLLASCLTNMLAMASIVFSMQVYDRVVPSQSMNTLHVLFGGVAITVVFGYLMKIARTRILDMSGRIADLRVSNRVFGHALRIKSVARPRATGTFIGQIRELEGVREILSSTTVSAIADVPFFLIFCAFFYYIAGPLVWIPVFAMVLLVLPGLVAQKQLRRLAEASAREGALRSAMLVETIQGIDDIKALQAETRFQNQWNHFTEVTSDASIRLRDLISRLSSWAQTVQGGVFILVVYVGAPQVMSGDMSTGVLVAASMLSSRMLAPMTSVAQIINRWQQAGVSREALDKLLALPVDAPNDAQRIHKPLIQGYYQLSNAVFGHNPEVPAVTIPNLNISPGERVGLLGRNGSGKSTLLAGLAGFLDPLAGEIRLDSVSIGLIDPADVRRDVGYVGQHARLFHGTLRENLTLGAPLASDEAILTQLDALSLRDFVQCLPDGLDHLVQEGGLGLSGGQCQGLLLARMLLRRSGLFLLDEPTAALDEVAENTTINTLKNIGPDTTLVIATHRPAVLRIVDRLIVLHEGSIALDGPKKDVLASLRGAKADVA